METTQRAPRPAVGPGRLLWLAWVALVLMLQAGCQSAAPSFSDLSNSDPRGLNYATNSLMEGDVLSINFQYSTNFNVIQKIGMDGTLNLEAVGQVKAAGKTPPQLQAELVQLYKPQVKDDVVTVKVVSAASCIYVSGAVLRPGKIPMERPMTVLEGVMEAGGFDPNRAKLKGVTVLRLEGGRQQTYHLDVSKMLNGQNAEPFYLRPFDIIHVPLKTFNF